MHAIHKKVYAFICNVMLFCTVNYWCITNICNFIKPMYKCEVCKLWMCKWMSVYDEWMSEYDEWMSVYDDWMSVYDDWMSVYDEWRSVYDEWMSVYEWMSEYDEWMSVYDDWMSVYDEWRSVYDEWMSVYDEWMSVYEWMSEYDEWMSVYDDWMSVYDEWMSVYDAWMQCMLGVCKDMNGECVWRILGEWRCDRLHFLNVLSRYLCKLLCVTMYNICISFFEKELSNCQTYCVFNVFY